MRALVQEASRRAAQRWLKRRGGQCELLLLLVPRPLRSDCFGLFSGAGIPSRAQTSARPGMTATVLPHAWLSGSGQRGCRSGPCPALQGRYGQPEDRGRRHKTVRDVVIADSAFVHPPISQARLYRLTGSATCFIPAFLWSGFRLFLASNPVMKTPVVM